jgi:putative alpha-1,2-mannosidase
MQKILSFFLTAILVVMFTQCNSDAGKEPVDYVDPLIGTSSSRWMLFPGAAMPFGMVKLSPDNTD